MDTKDVLLKELEPVYKAGLVSEESKRFVEENINKYNEIHNNKKNKEKRIKKQLLIIFIILVVLGLICTYFNTAYVYSFITFGGEIYKLNLLGDPYVNNVKLLASFMLSVQTYVIPMLGIFSLIINFMKNRDKTNKFMLSLVCVAMINLIILAIARAILC